MVLSDDSQIYLIQIAYILNYQKSEWKNIIRAKTFFGPTSLVLLSKINMTNKWDDIFYWLTDYLAVFILQLTSGGYTWGIEDMNTENANNEHTKKIIFTSSPSGRSPSTR